MRFLFDADPAHIVSGYLCGACWDVLVSRLAENRQYSIECVNCGENVPGFVSALYVEYRKRDSRNQYTQARQAMMDAWPCLFHQRKLPAKLLQELGY